MAADDHSRSRRGHHSTAGERNASAPGFALHFGVVQRCRITPAARPARTAIYDHTWALCRWICTKRALRSS
jgi:hypothetical protein